MEIPGSGLSASVQYFECGKGLGQSQPEEAEVKGIKLVQPTIRLTCYEEKRKLLKIILMHIHATTKYFFHTEDNEF